MQLRNGKVIGSILPSTSSKLSSIKTIPATPANSPSIQPINLAPIINSIVHYDLGSKAPLRQTTVCGIPNAVYTNSLGYTPFRPNYNSFFKETRCDCGKVCDLSVGKCCSCSDKRKETMMKEWRGHGIVYNNQTWSYCPKCRTADTEVHMDKTGEGYFH